VVRIVVVLLVVGLAAAGARAWLWPLFHHEERSNELVLYGNVDIRQVQLAFNGNDRIIDMRVKEGDRVRRGQMLAMVDTRRLKAAVARARAQVEAQRQVVARLEAGTRIEDIRKARADLELAEADVINAKRNYKRQSSLAELSAASQQVADDAEAAAAPRRGETPTRRYSIWPSPVLARKTLPRPGRH
jgi:HlyD family secretion protein